MQTLFSQLSGVLLIAGYVPYMRSILRGDTKPAKAAWLTWACLDCMLLAGMYAENAASYYVWAIFIGTSVTAALSLKYGTPGWSSLDKSCLAGVAAGVLLWQIVGSALLAIVIGLALAVIGSIPILVSAWHDPGCEDKFSWTIFWVASAVALAAVPHWTVADAALPATFFLVQGVLIGILYLRPYFLRS